MSIKSVNETAILGDQTLVIAVIIGKKPIRTKIYCLNVQQSETITVKSLRETFSSTQLSKNQP